MLPLTPCSLSAALDPATVINGQVLLPTDTEAPDGQGLCFDEAGSQFALQPFTLAYFIFSSSAQAYIKVDEAPESATVLLDIGSAVQVSFVP